MSDRNIKAFPATDQVWKGMDLRDYFAAHALQGVLANQWMLNKYAGCEPIDWSLNDLAGIVSGAYNIADAMMEARNDADD